LNRRQQNKYTVDKIQYTNGGRGFFSAAFVYRGGVGGGDRVSFIHRPYDDDDDDNGRQTLVVVVVVVVVVMVMVMVARW